VWLQSTGGAEFLGPGAGMRWRRVFEAIFEVPNLGFPCSTAEGAGVQEKYPGGGFSTGE
jgi:hypothetical protein